MMQYEHDRIRTIGEYLNAPSGKLHLDLHALRQESFPHNYRIIFSCYEALDDEVINDFVVSLQQSLTFLDIPNFFVLLISNNSDVESMLVDAHTKYSTEDAPIQFLFDDVATTEYNSAITALLNPPSTICAQPWISLDITAQGEYRPCCFYKDALKDNNGVAFHAQRDSFETVYNSDAMRQLREDFRQGKKPVHCKRCWNEEDNNTESKRQLLKHRFSPYSYNTNWEQDDISNLLFVSVAFGTTCNLKCRICTPYNSSQIATEAVENSGLENKKEHPAYQALIKGIWTKDDSAKIWEHLCEPNLKFKHLDISGGEPMMSNKHFKVLEQLVNMGKAQDITIHYNTNGTIFPQEHISLLKEFKGVDIALSIDNLSDRFEYERPGVAWDIVSKNVDSYLSLNSPNIKISLHLAVSIQNVYYLPEIGDWIDSKPFDSIHFSTLYDPQYLCITNVTPAARDLILSKLNAYHSNNEYVNEAVASTINILETAKTGDGQAFLKYMKRLDSIRNQNFANTHLEIARAMGY